VQFVHLEHSRDREQERYHDRNKLLAASLVSLSMERRIARQRAALKAAGYVL
jgi:hypothetical protein